MMTLRTLKKRSKQALPYLAQYPRQGETFLAVKGENYHGMRVRCRHLVLGKKHCDCQWHPLKGTPMVGDLHGHYEPEWEEETAFETLCRVVQWHDRPPSLSDDDWARMLRITRTQPVSLEEVAAMWKEGGP